MPAFNARLKAVSGRITARCQATVRFLESGNSLTAPEAVVQSSQRPTVAVGASSFGKCGLCRKPLLVRGYSHSDEGGTHISIFQKWDLAKVLYGTDMTAIEGLVIPTFKSMGSE